MGSAELAAKVASSAELEAAKPKDAVAVYRDVIFSAGGSDGESVKVKEQAIDKLAKLLAKLKDAPALKALLTELRPLFAVVPKAKTAKIVRNVIDVLATVPGRGGLYSCLNSVYP
jgi:26S proteasome regulatory subunit N6